ncbi:hypothetical protein H257_00027 [Aphanomyces astaci]|uniref:Uncharacterized protein n=1 Tax=Aphanomyces astaci TaxID=112090 RepID=W4HBA5_APHAT|nr:hypothetical protein H257_00027 [Aphanomyces astaci]ETV88403.1 hypothetical protein H257_00027 [Aphanomyces astaci]|eukprot:XP_009820803.1 hypothetical protein H257_00027 [Aphanomyces astaci]
MTDKYKMTASRLLQWPSPLASVVLTSHVVAPRAPTNPSFLRKPTTASAPSAKLLLRTASTASTALPFSSFGVPSTLTTTLQNAVRPTTSKDENPPWTTGYTLAVVEIGVAFRVVLLLL